MDCFCLFVSSKFPLDFTLLQQFEELQVCSSFSPVINAIFTIIKVKRMIHLDDVESFNTLLFLYFPVELISIRKGQEMTAFAHVHLCFQHCLCVQKKNHCGTLFLCDDLLLHQLRKEVITWE